MITGEALPVVKVAHDTVIGGTVNGPGSFIMRVTGVGHPARGVASAPDGGIQRPPRLGIVFQGRMPERAAIEG